MSADDGIRNLYLDFGGPEGELVSVFLKNMFILIGILFLPIASYLFYRKLWAYRLIFHLEPGNSSSVFKDAWVWFWGFTGFFSYIRKSFPFLKVLFEF